MTESAMETAVFKLKETGAEIVVNPANVLFARAGEDETTTLHMLGDVRVSVLDLIWDVEEKLDKALSCSVIA
jgi:hypothetical protein